MNAVELFAALGHESRLAIFRLLVEAGPDGAHASTIGGQLDIPAATLSFHLAHLSRVGLIRGERESRFIRYAAAYDTVDDLIAFVTHNCCRGKACLPKTRRAGRAASAKATAKTVGRTAARGRIKTPLKTPIKTRTAKDKA
ncbi:ArsR family regulatory protein [Burkholderiales bacterium GJ-E10]|nr:ArsR family regulatory protein [Burkholderiales bacterium GJ-E10]